MIPYWMSRTELMLGQENINALMGKNVLIIGLGGVGGICAEMIARAGVGKMTIVDAGANVGLHSLFFSRRVGEEGKIYAFEPAKMIFGRMMEHIQDNHVTNIEGLCLALGAKQGSAEIVDNEEDTRRYGVYTL
jgi:hypothetical protein